MTNTKQTNEEMPPIIIRNRKGWLNLDFTDLLRYREVLYLLTWRDFRVRYKQTVLGIVWVVLQPLLATLIFAVVFSRFARFETGEIPYALFALTGFTIWMFVNSTVTQASSSLIYHEQLVTKIYFPRIFVPSSIVIAGLPDLALTLPVLLLVVLGFGFSIGLNALLIPVFLVYAFVVALAVSIFLSALNVRFRDIKFVTPFFLQVWMFGSPVFYPGSWIPENLSMIFALNPLYGAIELFRWSLLGTPIDFTYIAISVSSAALFSLFSLFVFRKMEDDFADLL